MFAFLGILFTGIFGGGLLGTAMTEDDERRRNGFADMLFNTFGFEGAGIFNLFAGFLNMFGMNIPQFDIANAEGNRGIFHYVADLVENRETDTPVLEIGLAEEMVDQLSSDLGLPRDLSTQIVSNPDALREIPAMLQAAGVTFNGLALPGNLREKVLSEAGINALLDRGVSTNLRDVFLSADGIQALLANADILELVTADMTSEEKAVFLQNLQGFDQSDYARLAAAVADSADFAALQNDLSAEVTGIIRENVAADITPENVAALLGGNLNAIASYPIAEDSVAGAFIAANGAQLLALVGTQGEHEALTELTAVIKQVLESGQELKLNNVSSLMLGDGAEATALRTALLQRLQNAESATEVNTALAAIAANAEADSPERALYALLAADSDVAGKSNLQVVLELANSDPEAARAAISIMSSMAGGNVEAINVEQSQVSAVLSAVQAMDFTEIESFVGDTLIEKLPDQAFRQGLLDNSGLVDDPSRTDDDYDGLNTVLDGLAQIASTEESETMTREMKSQSILAMIAAGSYTLNVQDVQDAGELPQSIDNAINYTVALSLGYER